MRNAREKADKMVTAAGSRTGKVITIDENPNSQKSRYNQMDSFSMAAQSADQEDSGQAAPQLLGMEAKPVEISVSISAVFGIE